MKLQESGWFVSLSIIVLHDFHNEVNLIRNLYMWQQNPSLGKLTRAELSEEALVCVL